MNLLKQFKTSLNDFIALQHKWAHLGAEDTAVRELLIERLINVLNGKGWRKNGAENWYLYDGKESRNQIKLTVHAIDEDGYVYNELNQIIKWCKRRWEGFSIEKEKTYSFKELKNKALSIIRKNIKGWSKFENCISELKKGSLYKFTYSSANIDSFDHGKRPRYNIVVFRGFQHDDRGLPSLIYDIIISNDEYQVSRPASKGSYRGSCRCEPDVLKNIEPISVKDFPLYVNDYKSILYEKLMKGSKK